MRTMKKCYQRDEKSLVDQIKVVVELLGFYVEIDLSLQIFLKLLNEEDTRNSPRLVSNLLVMRVFSEWLPYNATTGNIQRNHQERK